MANKGLRNFYLSIVTPSVMAVTLFIVLFFFIIIPSFENTMMDRKKEMISELTKTALSLIDEYNTEYKNGKMSLEDAQKQSASRVELMRYGSEAKDYFWISDMKPTMIMHPYRKDLYGTDLSDYKDPKGKALFVEAIKVVKAHNEGYIDYLWQWKDDSTQIVPKLSYVKAYPEWGWIVGTGIYLDDVKAQISSLHKRLLIFSLIIIIVIIAIIAFTVRQSLNIEKRRKDAEDKLKLSRQKYMSLVEASTEGTIMLMDEKVIFSNYKINDMIGISSVEMLTRHFDELFVMKWVHIMPMFKDPQKSLNLETQLKCVNKAPVDIVISVSRIIYAGQESYVVTTKDITRQKQIERDTENLSSELQASLMLMNQPITHFFKDIIRCPMTTSIEQTAQLMTKKKQNVVFIDSEKKIVGVVTDSDLRQRVLAKSVDVRENISQIMTSPVISLPDNFLLFEAILAFRKEGTSHLAVRNSDGSIYGVISNEDLLEIQRNTLSFLVREAEKADEVMELTQIHQKIPVLVNALLESGAKTKTITRIVTSLTDAITKRLIELAIEEIGLPPASFSFIALGSEGRKEQTLATDQDNAIIFEDVKEADTEMVRDYFLNMGTIVCRNLDTIGYKYCKGDVMAQNKKWVQPLKVWKGYASEWINNSNPQNLLDASIFFDCRSVYGDYTLADNYRYHINSLVDGNSVFFYNLAQTIMKIKMPSFFSSIMGADKSGSFDIKMVMMPFTGFMRIYALKSKLSETNTHDRLDRLSELKVINKNLGDELLFSFDYLLSMRFKVQIELIMKNQGAANIVEVQSLTDIEKSNLKKILSNVSDIQSKLSFDFTGTAT